MGYFKDDFKQPPSLKIPAALLGTLITASALHHYWNSPGDEGKYVTDLHANEMFCRSPGFEQDVFFDPFERAQKQGGFQNYGQFWSEENEQKMISFGFDYNSTVSRNFGSFFQSIPKEVIDDPKVTFILSGHATYDLDEQLGLRTGLAAPKDFDRLHVRHLKNNFEIVSGRLDYIKGKLIAAGIPESRIVLHNLNTRFDKRAVDLEVCTPPGID